MSVRLNDRGLSGVQFIDTARELFIHTITYARKFPKSAMFFVTKDIADKARAVYNHVIAAQSVGRPRRQADIEIRYRHFKEAIACIYNLSALIGVSIDMYDLIKSEKGDDDKANKNKISDYGWTHWAELMDKEESLIKAVIESDKSITF